MKFYVDECLPHAAADDINLRKGSRAVHAARDLGFAGRDDEFHIAESRRRGEIFITSNHREFKRGFGFLRRHPGIVVLNTGAWTNSDDLLGGISLMFEAFRIVRIGAKPPFRNDLYERRLVVSSQLIYLEDAAGQRFDIYPATNDADWRPSPQLRR